MKVRLKKTWRHYAAGFELEVDRGVADMLVNRRHLADYVTETMVPEPAGLSQMVSAAGKVLNRKGK